VSEEQFTRRHRPRSLLLLASALLAAFGTIALMVQSIERAGIGYPRVGMLLGINMPKRIGFAEEEWAGRRSIAFLGDSTVMAYPAGEKLTDELRRGLDERSPSTYGVGHLAAGGASVFEFYSLAELLIDSSPDWVIIPINLASMSKGWHDLVNRPQLIGWVPLREYPTALGLPLHWWGVTLDRMLLWRSFVASGHAQLWYDVRREQLRSGRVVQHLRRSLQGVPGRGDGLPSVRWGIDPARPARYNAEGARHSYGVAIAGAARDHPIIALLEALLRRLGRHGLSVVVYVVPVNVDNLESLGVLEGNGLRRTIGELEAVTLRQGASFLDLSHLLPDRAFRDSGGHFTVDEPLDGPKLVAEELAEFFSSTAARN